MTDEGKERLVVVDLIGRVSNDETPPFRPQMPTNSRASGPDHQRLVALVRDCWAQDETTRPTITAVRTRFAAFNKGKSVQLICTFPLI